MSKILFCDYYFTMIIDYWKISCCDLVFVLLGWPYKAAWLRFWIWGRVIFSLIYVFLFRFMIFLYIEDIYALKTILYSLTRLTGLKLLKQRDTVWSIVNLIWFLHHFSSFLYDYRVELHHSNYFCVYGLV